MKTNNKLSDYKRSVGIAMSTLLIGASMTLVTSCKDDHFDVTSDVAGPNSTIWQSIQSQENLSQFANILQKLRYSRSETQTTGETYADVLNGQQQFTVWAPENGSFDYSYYESLLNSGKRDSIYKVEKEFVRNHIARFSKQINGSESERIQMFNSKYAQIDYAKGTIKGCSMEKTNIASGNGMLHIIKNPIPFQPNLYEFLSQRPGVLDSVSNFIKKFETHQLNESASTQGAVVDGVVQWVDSVMDFQNPYLTSHSYLNARLNSEDSVYAMILPSNNAWANAYKKIEGYYNYIPEYKQQNHTLTAEQVDTTVTAEYKCSPEDLDSVKRENIKNGIIRKLCFNSSWQFRGPKDLSSIQAIKALDAAGDSLRSTNGGMGTIYKKSGALSAKDASRAIEVPSFEAMFGGKDPIEVSNGYAYIIDDYDAAIPTGVYLSPLTISSVAAYESCEKNSTITRMGNSLSYSRLVPVPTDTGYMYVEKKQDVIANFTALSPNPRTRNAKPQGYFRLPQVLSCAYDIKVVIYWNYMPNRFDVQLEYHKGDKADREKVSLNNPNPDAPDVDDPTGTTKQGNHFENRLPYTDPATGNRVYADTIVVAKDFYFPVCYEGIDNIYPLLTIKSNFTNAYNTKRNSEILVGNIILEPSKNQPKKEDEE